VTGRWLKFSTVGLIGVGVQLAVLVALTKLGVDYLVATAVAVEIALLHNYAWHRRWTWADRDARSGRLLRFHLANGLVSLLSNLVWMRVLTGGLGVPAVPANLAAITVTSLLNFALGERWVFTRSTEGARGRVESLL
jgi:putative flippase GtrA